MHIVRTREIGTVGRIAWLGGLLCIAAGPSGCARDEINDPLNPTAALAEMANGGLIIDPDSATISEAGDTVRLSVMLSSSSDGVEPTPVDAGWFVLDPEIVEVEGGRTGQTLLVRGAQAGAARIVATHNGLAAIARVWVEEGDTTRIPVAAAVSNRQPVLLVGDTITIRPNLVDEDSALIPTDPSEWSTDFDSEFLSVSEEFLVTALAPTPPGSTSVIRHTHIETDLAAEAGVVVLPDEDPGEWPDNEPPGMTTILLVDGSSKNWPGFLQYNGWQDDERVAIVEDPDSKHGTAIEKRFFVGDESGWHGVTSTENFGAWEELYIRIVFRLSPNWQWHNASGKYFYYGAASRDRFVGPTQFVLGWEADGTTRWSAHPDGRWIAEGVPPPTRDVYHTIEIQHTASTSGANGSLRMWENGVEVQSFTLKNGDGVQSGVKPVNQEWMATRLVDDKRLSGMQAFLFWGGQGDTKRVDDWIRLSELYISGRN